ncbi:MAG: alpha/beta fold hydrolase [Bacteroidota bacterium]
MRPEWLNPVHYPFKAYWFSPSGQRLHYLDEGKGPVLVLLHGFGSWSYLYRNLLKELMAEYRCLVPDLPGFGFSDRADFDFEAELQLLSDWLASTVSGPFSLLGHDAGALWAQHLGARFAERLDHLVLLNGWEAHEQEKRRSQIGFLTRNPLGRWWQGQRNPLLRRRLGLGALREARIAYLKQYPDPHSRRQLAKRLDDMLDEKAFSQSPALAQIPTHRLTKPQPLIPESSHQALLRQVREFLSTQQTPSSNSHA